MNVKVRKTNLLILGIILILSLTNIYNQLFKGTSNYINFLSVIISIVGILALIFYIKNNRKYTLLTFIWAYSQTIIITKYNSGFGLTQINQIPIWNMDQNQILDININIGMNFIYQNNTYTLNYNLLSILFIILAQIIYSNSIIGVIINLKSLKKESVLNKILPSSGTLKDKMTIGKEKKWFLIHFGEENSNKYALIKTKDGGKLRPNQKGQIVLMHYFEDSDKLKEINPKFNLKDSDWAMLD